MCPPLMFNNGAAQMGMMSKGESGSDCGLSGLDTGMKVARGDQKSCFDNSVLNVVLAMHHNMGFQQRTQIVSVLLWLWFKGAQEHDSLWSYYCFISVCCELIALWADL